eukprot:TRINITY_DN88491_c0_g1_i1.p1 TRINITY_DN88491_c0_g1~~TRINITY_DN88491_c0_g1_i1.p1  ORF type:complete len:422 (+),score=69.85 TRINITY_DN88491_c0_g1_i1:59-1324(+)
MWSLAMQTPPGRLCNCATRQMQHSFPKPLCRAGGTVMAVSTASMVSYRLQSRKIRTGDISDTSARRAAFMSRRMLRALAQSEDPDAYAAHACSQGSGNAGASALASLDLEGVAKYIKSGNCKSIVVLTGAGVSTGAGIPDFRSPGGMYDTLQPDLITATDMQRAKMQADPTWVVMRSMFFENQFPYLEVRRPFILGTYQQQWKATLSHWFMKFLEEEGLLTRIYTQNIDGLDYQTGLSPELVCNVHGSLGQVHCEYCGAGMPLDKFCSEVRAKIKDIYGIDDAAPAESSNILCQNCGHPCVKPSTVLFGSSLPSDFFDRSSADLPKADLLIIAGTSLVVAPANSVVTMVRSDCPRLIVNRERVGQDLGIRYGPDASRDVFVGDRPCDEVFFEMIQLLGWHHRLHAVRDRLPQQNKALVANL